MPKKPSKRKKTKRSKEMSLLKNLTKAFVNLTEIEKQKLSHKRKHSSERSHRKPSSHKRSERSHRKPSSYKRSERSHRKINILQPLIQKDILQRKQLFSNKISPVKIREKKKPKKKMNIFNLEKKTFINQAKLL